MGRRSGNMEIVYDLDFGWHLLLYRAGVTSHRARGSGETGCTNNAHHTHTTHSVAGELRKPPHLLVWSIPLTYLPPGPSLEYSTYPPSGASLQYSTYPLPGPSLEYSTYPPSGPSLEYSTYPPSGPSLEYSTYPLPGPSLEYSTYTLPVPSLEYSTYPPSGASLEYSTYPPSGPSLEYSTYPLPGPSLEYSTYPLPGPSLEYSTYPPSGPSLEYSTYPPSGPSLEYSTYPPSGPSLEYSTYPPSGPSLEYSTYPLPGPSLEYSTYPLPGPSLEYSTYPPSGPSLEYSTYPPSGPSLEYSTYPPSGPSLEYSTYPLPGPSLEYSTYPLPGPSLEYSTYPPSGPSLEYSTYPLPGPLLEHPTYPPSENLFSPRRASKNVTSPWHLPPDALNISIALLNKKPCVQIGVSINASGLPTFRGFDIQLLELSYNTFHSIRILKRNASTVQDLWQLEFYCWIVKPSQKISVSLLTNPNYGITLEKEVYILDYNKAPSFQYQHFAEEKRIAVSMPHRKNAYARLCYKRYFCHNLNGSKGQLFNSSRGASLPYDTLLPCLCIEVSYEKSLNERRRICPFEEQPEPYFRDLMRVSAKNVTFGFNTMSVEYYNRCLYQPEVSLCRKQNGSCVTIPEATIKEDNMNYYISDIDRDPNLCFKFTLMSHTYEKCPRKSDRVWNVDVKINLFDVLLKISSEVSASFSGAICYRNQSMGACSIQSVVHKFSAPYPTHPTKMQLSLPWPGIGWCIKVWRSDVRFSHEYVICSFDYSHKHLGLIALAALLVVFSLTLVAFVTFRRIWKIFTAPLWRRTILLVYSPDSSEHKNLICAFANFLQSILGCEVILDMWDMNTVSQIGMLPWFYQKRELVSQRNGKVMIVWTTRTKSMYQQWTNRQLNSLVWKDPANLFGAAMSCLSKDLGMEQEAGKLKEYAIVYFEGLCERKDIPKSLSKISSYRLFKDLYRLVSKLQDTTCLSPPCLIKAVAKYLMKKLIRLEKTKGLQHHIELCRQRLYEEVSAEKKKMESTVL
ncbi:interleukin-17 receptor E [Mantella aurantiaca]